MMKMMIIMRPVFVRANVRIMGPAVQLADMYTEVITP